MIVVHGQSPKGTKHDDAVREPPAASLWLKLAYTAFMAVLMPVYWYYYGPTNFLYFCDVALILTLVGIWLESPLLVSMCAVGILSRRLYGSSISSATPSASR